MALVRKLTKDQHAELPDAVRGAYVEHEGEMILDFPDETSSWKKKFEAKKQDLDRVHQELATEREFRTALGEEDPEEIKRIITEHKALRDKKLIEEGEVDQVVETRVGERTKKMRDEYDKRIAELELSNDTLNSRLGVEVIDTKVLNACVAHDVLPSAKDDVMSRVRKVFKIDKKSGEMTPYNSDGSIAFGATGERLTLDELFEQLKSDAPHLFKPSNGSGALNAAGSGASTGGALRRSQMTDEQKVKYVAEHGREALANLPQ